MTRSRQKRDFKVFKICCIVSLYPTSFNKFDNTWAFMYLSIYTLQGLNTDKVRPNVPKIAIILTDGMSQNMKETLEEAKVIHAAGIIVFVIGKKW